MRLIDLLILCAFAINHCTALKNLKSVTEWKQLEYAFPSQQARQAALVSGQYVPGNGVPIDVDVDYRDNVPSRIFVSIPRFTTGIPITFGSVGTTGAAGGPIIHAYPDYSWQNSHGANCNGITSVFRVTIDECRRLWVLDTGRIADQQYCPPQLVVFNLDNDVVIHRYRFPPNQYRPGTSLFITPVLDIRDPPPRGTCQNTKVYIADVTGYGILVYDTVTNRSWRIQNKLVFAHPPHGTFTIARESFDLMDGIIGMAISPRQGLRDSQNGNDGRQLYFHALASITENAVPLSVLNNETIWRQNVDNIPRSFQEIGTRQSQSAAQAIDSNGNLFFGLMTPIALACWDSERTYTPENIQIVAQNDATLQFASGIKVIQNRKGKEELWVLTCRFQRVMAGSINHNEVNFRIQAIQIDELLNGNKCSGSGSAIGAHNHQGY